VPHPRRLWLLTVIGLLLSLCVGQGLASAPAATSSVRTRATARLGHDVSWPQCGTGHDPKQGMHLPGGSSSFVIVGLTNGRAFHTNPCLVGQLAYAKAHADGTAAYMMANAPTRAELAASVNGPLADCTPRDTHCQLRNAGAREAIAALAVLAKVHLSTALLWVDVEDRVSQPWNYRDKAGNAAVLQGIALGLTHAGVTPGWYSTKELWRGIAGSYRVPTKLEWYALGYAGVGALRRACSKGFAGGQAVITQAIRGGFDTDQLCGGAAAADALTAMILKPQAPQPLSP
jgi:hypothetical protein